MKHNDPKMMEDGTFKKEKRKSALQFKPPTFNTDRVTCLKSVV